MRRAFVFMAVLAWRVLGLVVAKARQAGQFSRQFTLVVPTS
jgi:hypothetical protein